MGLDGTLPKEPPGAATLSEPLPGRGQTPIPDEQLEEGDVWKSDQNIVVMSSFLTCGIWSAASEKHIRILVKTDRRNGYTTVPIQFDNPLNPSTVLLYLTNSKGQWKQEYISLDKLDPSPLNGKGQLVMVLNGVHEGHIYKAITVSRKHQTAIFESDGERWEENYVNLCMVEEHQVSACKCENAH